MKLLKMKWLILIFLILLVTLFIVSWLLFRNYDKSYEVKRSLSKEETFNWEQDIQSLGGKRAFEKFKDQVKSSKRSGSHFRYHVFGKLLYEKYGPEAIAFCDTSLQFGCFHGVFSNLISEAGVESIKKLDAVCIEKFSEKDLSCKHGIGHGLMEFYGPNKLSFALDRCKELKVEDLIGGCASGVFMEYNFPLLVVNDKTISARRLYDEQKLDFPCDTINPNSRRVCYFELGKFWQTIYYQDVKRAGEICSHLTNSEYANYCYMGIGNKIVAESLRGLDETIESCRQMPDMNSQIYCRIGGSLSFAIESLEIRDARIVKFCKDLPSEDLKKCTNLKDMDLRT